MIRKIGFPCGSNSKESDCNTEDPGLTPRSGRSPGEGNGNPLQYSCLGNPTDRGAWGPKSQTRLKDSHFHFHKISFSSEIPQLHYFRYKIMEG